VSALFAPAYEKLRLLEGTRDGGYVHHPDDPGGETYAGIARRFWPNWEGWRLIDAAKVYSDFPANLERPPLKAALEAGVADFYDFAFWKPMRLADFPDQDVADEVFEQGVNLGAGKAAAILQTALNALNNHGKRWPDVKVDGELGGKTLGAVHACHWQKMDDELRLAINCLQGAHYLASRNEVFTRGWLRRVSL
jgi:lysozyme family protein